MKLRIARAASRDLEEIGDWMSGFDPDAAVRYVAALEAKARQIASMPYAFPAVPGETRGTLRKRSHRRYIIFYRVGRTTVTILRILRHSRDSSELLRTR